MYYNIRVWRLEMNTVVFLCFHSSDELIIYGLTWLTIRCISYHSFALFSRYIHIWTFIPITYYWWVECMYDDRWYIEWHNNYGPQFVSYMCSFCYVLLIDFNLWKQSYVLTMCINNSCICIKSTCFIYFIIQDFISKSLTWVSIEMYQNIYTHLYFSLIFHFMNNVYNFKTYV